MQTNQINFKVENFEREIIKIASSNVGLSLSGFIRMATLKQAKEIIQDLNLEITPTT